MKKPFKKLEAGDKVELIVNRKPQRGILLDSYDPSVILLKLENGYNIGFKKSDVSEIKLIEKRVVKQKDVDFKNSGQKPIIDLFITGGTISGKLDPTTGGVKGLIDPKELFLLFPEIFEIADIRVHSPFLKLSENMMPADWMKLAKLVGKSLKNPEVKGVIITHGTDTLHFTGSALSFMLGKLNKPVVLTYSQRSSDRGSSDSRLNLICSAHAALSDIAEVMLVGHATIHDDFCYALQGNKVRKMHSSRRDAFKAVNSTPFAKVFPNGKIELLRNDFNKRNKNKVVIDAVFDEKVSLLKIHPGIIPAAIDYYRKNCKGLVIEGTGFGHVACEGKYNLVPSLKIAITSGLLVYMTTQTIFGRVDPFVYTTGRKLQDIGVVFLNDMLPETALVKLGWVLGHKEWRGTVATKLKMLENVNGEMNERLGVEFNS
ncbi:MAG: hypothetical protein RL557_893 [archaeon]|jgi:glutamyl-tRNA(Gln) amidotransferase subunit D